jgi:hypothetical protein
VGQVLEAAKEARRREEFQAAEAEWDALARDLAERGVKRG